MRWKLVRTEWKLVRTEWKLVRTGLCLAAAPMARRL